MDNDHGRSKYKRTIHCLETPTTAIVDVYSVLEAFQVTCPARQHLIKKILCTGIRGKGDSLQDLEEAKVALDRAIVLEKNRQRNKDENKGVVIAIDNLQFIDVTDMQEVVDTKRWNDECWRVVQVFDGGNCVGYRVGWPVNGGYFFVRHYMSGEGKEPSLNWCLNAAEGNARAFNETKRHPSEFSGWSEIVKETKDNEQG